MRPTFLTSALAAALAAAALPVHGAARPQKAKAPAKAAAAQTQLKKLQAENEDLKSRLAATENLQQDLAAAEKSRDLARQEAEGARRELDRLRGDLKENQSGSENLIQSLKTAKDQLEEARADYSKLEEECEGLRKKAARGVQEGDLVPMGEDVAPAQPINLGRVTPRLKGGFFGARPKGVVVVNVLVNERGEVTATRLIQPMAGDGPEVKDANEACLEAAKRLVFDPARAGDGKVKVKVWQGVGFYLD